MTYVINNFVYFKRVIKMKNKIILIEGTDCSGKQTQTEMLVDKLNSSGIKAVRLSFPMYDSPTGKIIAGPYLGKEQYGVGYFDEGASHVDPKVASLFFTADRLYNIKKIYEKLDAGYTIVLDRYVESNMAHQGGKFANVQERNKMIDWIEKLEYKFLKLPRPNQIIFLHMPAKFSQELKQNRKERGDQHENDLAYLKRAEKTYLYLAKHFKYQKVDCVANNKIKSKDDISKEIFKLVMEELNKNGI